MRGTRAEFARAKLGRVELGRAELGRTAPVRIAARSVVDDCPRRGTVVELDGRRGASDPERRAESGCG